MPKHIINMIPEAMATFAFNWLVHDFQHDANPFALGGFKTGGAAYERWSGVTAFDLAGLNIFGGAPDFLAGGGQKESDNVQRGGASYDMIKAVVGDDAQGNAHIFTTFLKLLIKLKLCLCASSLKSYNVTTMKAIEAHTPALRAEQVGPAGQAIDNMFGTNFAHAEVVLKQHQCEFSKFLFLNFNRQLSSVTEDPLWAAGGNVVQFAKLFHQYIDVYHYVIFWLITWRGGAGVSEESIKAGAGGVWDAALADAAASMQAAGPNIYKYLLGLDKLGYAKLTAAWLTFFSFERPTATHLSDLDPNKTIYEVVEGAGAEQQGQEGAVIGTMPYSIHAIDQSNCTDYFKMAMYMYDIVSYVFEMPVEPLRTFGDTIGATATTYETILAHGGTDGRPFSCQEFMGEGSTVNNRLLFLHAINQKINAQLGGPKLVAEDMEEGAGGEEGAMAGVEEDDDEVLLVDKYQEHVPPMAGVEGAMAGVEDDGNLSGYDPAQEGIATNEGGADNAATENITYFWNTYKADAAKAARGTWHDIVRPLSTTFTVNGRTRYNIRPFIINYCLTPFFSQKLAQELSIYQMIEKLTYVVPEGKDPLLPVDPDKNPCPAYRPTIFYRTTGREQVARGPAVGRTAFEHTCSPGGGAGAVIFFRVPADDKDVPDLAQGLPYDHAQTFSTELAAANKVEGDAGQVVAAVPFADINNYQRVADAIFRPQVGPGFDMNAPQPPINDNPVEWQAAFDGINTRTPWLQSPAVSGEAAGAYRANLWRKLLWMIKRSNDLLLSSSFSPLVIDGIQRKYIRYRYQTNLILVWWTYGDYPWDWWPAGGNGQLDIDADPETAYSRGVITFSNTPWACPMQTAAGSLGIRLFQGNSSSPARWTSPGPPHVIEGFMADPPSVFFDNISKWPNILEGVQKFYSSGTLGNINDTIVVSSGAFTQQEGQWQITDSNDDGEVQILGQGTIDDQGQFQGNFITSDGSTPVRIVGRDNATITLTVLGNPYSPWPPPGPIDPEGSATDAQLAAYIVLPSGEPAHDAPGAAAGPEAMQADDAFVFGAAPVLGDASPSVAFPFGPPPPAAFGVGASADMEAEEAHAAASGFGRGLPTAASGAPAADMDAESPPGEGDALGRTASRERSEDDDDNDAAPSPKRSRSVSSMSDEGGRNSIGVNGITDDSLGNEANIQKGGAWSANGLASMHWSWPHYTTTIGFVQTLYVPQPPQPPPQPVIGTSELAILMLGFMSNGPPPAGAGLEAWNARNGPILNPKPAKGGSDAKLTWRKYQDIILSTQYVPGRGAVRQATQALLNNDSNLAVYCSIEAANQKSLFRNFYELTVTLNEQMIEMKDVASSGGPLSNTKGILESGPSSRLGQPPDSDLYIATVDAAITTLGNIITDLLSASPLDWVPNPGVAQLPVAVAGSVPQMLSAVLDTQVNFFKGVVFLDKNPKYSSLQLAAIKRLMVQGRMAFSLLQAGLSLLRLQDDSALVTTLSGLAAASLLIPPAPLAPPAPPAPPALATVALPDDTVGQDNLGNMWYTTLKELVDAATAADPAQAALVTVAPGGAVNTLGKLATTVLRVGTDDAVARTFPDVVAAAAVAATAATAAADLLTIKESVNIKLYICACLYNMQLAFIQYRTICTDITTQDTAPQVLSDQAKNCAGYTTCATVVCMHKAFDTVELGGGVGNLMAKAQGISAATVMNEKLGLFKIDYDVTKSVLKNPGQSGKGKSTIDSTAFKKSVEFMTDAGTGNRNLRWPTKKSQLINIEPKDNSWTVWKDGGGNKSSVVIPYENTIFGAAIADPRGNADLVIALEHAQATVNDCFDRGLACKISNASVIKPTYYGLQPPAATGVPVPALDAAVYEMGSPAVAPDAPSLEAARKSAAQRHVSRVITFCPTSSVADAAAGACNSSRGAAAGPGLEYGIIHVVIQAAVPGQAGPAAGAHVMRIELQSTPYRRTGAGWVPCSDNDQVPGFVMIRMHAKIGTETVINIGNLQDNTADNVNQDPDPETNGLTGAQQNVAAGANPIRPSWIVAGPPSANPGLPGLKVAMDGTKKPLMAAEAIKGATASILRVFQGTGSWSAFMTKIQGSTGAAGRCRLLVNNKSIVKSLGDSIQEINGYAPNGGYVSGGPWQNPVGHILPPQGDLVGDILSGFRWIDCQDQPSGERGAIATMYGDNINPTCISSFSTAGDDGTTKRTLRSVLAVRYDTPADPPDPQMGGKTNRKKTIRRRKHKQSKKSKYQNKRDKKRSTLKKGKKNTKKHVSKKRRRNTKRK
jgi:hypothetical protein